MIDHARSHGLSPHRLLATHTLIALGIALAALAGCAPGDAVPSLGQDEADMGHGQGMAAEPQTMASEPMHDRSASGADDEAEVPAELTAGKEAFARNCAQCHGEAATGTDQGPPLVHKIYEPSHHPDQSFFNAAQLGVRAHHWPFGDMPPVEDVTEAEVQEILSYVRYLQREAGIQ